MSSSKVTITVASEEAARKLADLTRELNKTADAQERLKGTAGSGRTTGGAPPPAPTAGPGGSHASHGSGGFGQPFPAPGGGGGGAPPPPPSGGGGGGGGAPPPPPSGGGYDWPGKRKPTGPDDAFVWDGDMYVPTPSGGWRKAPQKKQKGPQDTPYRLDEFGQYMVGKRDNETWRQWGSRSIMAGAGFAIGYGAGTSLMGLPFKAVDTYMQLSTVVAELGDRFRGAETAASGFANQLGYTKSQAAEIEMALGAVSSRFTSQQGANYVGFARAMGFRRNPTQIAQGLARIGELGTEGALTNDQIAQIELQSKAAGFERTRLAEFMQRVTGAAEQQFALGGAATIEGSLALATLPGFVFAEGDPRRTNNTTMVQGLQNVMGSTAAQSLMMRLVGYGTDPSLGFVEARMMAEKGVTDPENIARLFGYFQDRGTSRAQVVSSLVGASGGSLKWHEAAALADAFGTEEGLERYREMTDPEKSAALAAAMGRDYSKEGANASEGETRAQATESVLYDAGKTFAGAALDMVKASGNMIEAMNNAIKFFGADGGLEGLTQAIVDLTEWLKTGTAGAVAGQSEMDRISTSGTQREKDALALALELGEPGVPNAQVFRDIMTDDMALPRYQEMARTRKYYTPPNPLFGGF